MCTWMMQYQKIIWKCHYDIHTALTRFFLLSIIFFYYWDIIDELHVIQYCYRKSYLLLCVMSFCYTVTKCKYNEIAANAAPHENSWYIFIFFFSYFVSLKFDWRQMLNKQIRWSKPLLTQKAHEKKIQLFSVFSPIIDSAFILRTYIFASIKLKMTISTKKIIMISQDILERHFIVVQFYPIHFLYELNYYLLIPSNLHDKQLR